MNFSQEILTALTTPNETLVNTLGIPLTFLDAFICMQFFTTVLNIKANKTRKLIYVLVYGTLGCLVNFVVPASYTIFVNMILWPVMVFFILKTTVLKSILSEVMTLALTSILDFTCSNVALDVFNIAASQIMVIPLYRIIVAFSIYLTIYFITLIIKYLKINIGVIDNMSTRAKTLLIANLVLMALVHNFT